MGGEEAQTVLVVDDDESLRMLCRVNLELEGYRVLEAATLAVARQLFASEPVDAVLLDIHVGEQDGFTLVEEFRKAAPRAGIALFTGSGEIDTIRRGAVEEVLSKPFTLEELSGAVSRLVAL